MYKKMIALTIVVAGVLLVATPAKAFYLELPNILKFWMGTTHAQEATAEVLAPAPSTEPTTVVVPTTELVPIITPTQETTIAPAPVNEPQPQPQPAPMAPTEQPAPTCRVNGVDMPGSCDQYNNQLNNQPDNQPMQDSGEGQTTQQQNNDRRLADTQRWSKDVERRLKEFERAKKSYEKSGGVVDQSTNDNLQKVRDIIQAIKNAKSNEELDAIASDELNDLMSSLDEVRSDIFEAQQRLDGLKRGVKGMSQGVKSFESQVNRLIKQKIAVPVAVTEDLAKIKAMIEAVKNAKTYDEAEAAGVEDMQDLMQNLNENRQQLEMLARWPQTLKQIDKELKNLDRQLKKDRTVVDRLAKKEIDLTMTYESFAAAIEKLKTVKAGAVAKMAEGDSETAFDLVENDFFGQMEDVWQSDKVIQMMNNLGQFKSQFSRSITQTKAAIKKLERAKKDATEVKDLLAQMQEKGNEILGFIKSKTIDEDVIVPALEEMEDISQQMESKMSELAGENEDMPWETGPQQFKQVQMPSTMNRYLPQKTVQVEKQIQQPMQQ